MNLINDKPIRQVILSITEAEAPLHRGPDGEMDDVALRTTVWLRLSEEHPEAAKGFTALARDIALKMLIDFYIRHAKKDFLTSRKADEVHRGQMRMFVRVPVGPRLYITKHRRDIRKGELLKLADYHKKMGGAHAVEEAWCHWAYDEMEARGLKKTDTVSVILEELAA